MGFHKILDLAAHVFFVLECKLCAVNFAKSSDFFFSDGLPKLPSAGMVDAGWRRSVVFTKLTEEDVVNIVRNLFCVFYYSNLYELIISLWK